VCYYIYGALSGNLNDYETVANNYEIKLPVGTKHDVKMAVKQVDFNYRVTNGCCDCESELGKGDAEAEEVKRFERLINDMKSIKGAEHIYLCRTWNGKTNKNEKRLKLDDINIRNVLADFEENCLYVFEI